MADITNKNIKVPGVNCATNYVQQYAYCVDFATLDGIAGTGTHDIVKLPKGEALLGLRIVALESATSGGSATLQFKLSVGGTATAINSSTIALAGLTAGMIQNLPANNLKSFSGDGEGVLQMVVGTAAYTGGKFLLIAETLPAEAYVTNG